MKRDKQTKTSGPPRLFYPVPVPALEGGIEKHLVKVFGAEAVKEVVNLDGSEPGGALSLSREAVEAHLEKLSGAIHNYGQGWWWWWSTRGAHLAFLRLEVKAS